MAVAVFVLGGAASGKSSVVRDRYVGTLDVYAEDHPRASHPRDTFSLQRWYDADRYKLTIPMYSPAPGDQTALQRFNDPRLGGPSGPKSPEELALYPEYVHTELSALLDDAGFESVEEFAREVIMEAGEETVHFGRGLTHELSKFIAAAEFEGQLEEGPRAGSVVWDATGNTDRYAYWIEMALEQGYEVEVVYVTCPLSVALMRAAKRERQVPPGEVLRTHGKAAKTADDLEIMTGAHPLSDRTTFERIPTSSEGEEAEAIAAGYGEEATRR